MRLPLPLPALLVALAVACNGGAQQDLTDREITDEELRLMVLPQSDLGPEYADFEPGSLQLLSNEGAIEDAFDPDDEALDVERFGRLKGYGRAYRSFSTREEDLLVIGTSVTLFKDTTGASRYLRDEAEDIEQAIETTSEDITLVNVARFSVGDVGDEALGLVQTGRTGLSKNASICSKQVWFRRGRLQAVAVIGGSPCEDIPEEAAALARKLDERILAVLRGELSRQSPVPTP